MLLQSMMSDEPLKRTLETVTPLSSSTLRTNHSGVHCWMESAEVTMSCACADVAHRAMRMVISLFMVFWVLFSIIYL